MIEATDYHVTKSQHQVRPTDGRRNAAGRRTFPQPADVAVCAYGGHLQAYDDDLSCLRREIIDAGKSKLCNALMIPDKIMAQHRGQTHDHRSLCEPR